QEHTARIERAKQRIAQIRQWLANPPNLIADTATTPIELLAEQHKVDFEGIASCRPQLDRLGSIFVFLPQPSSDSRLAIAQALS
ncbi:MAG: hypothetical protein K0U93_21385, partial [Gammaproteobacteria bacterium]|nr:hypothetical protein [Gammaproteobacteria bacterium]